MNDTAEAQYATDGALSGAAVLAAIKAAKIEYVLSVPDITSSKGLLRPISQDPDLKLIRVCKEDECIGIASGLAHGHKRALILIQNTGFYDSINAIRGVAIEFGRPICMMIGLLERDVGVPLKESRRYAIRIIEPMLDVLGIERHLIEDDGDVAAIGPAVDRCYAESKPMALLLGRRPA